MLKKVQVVMLPTNKKAIISVSIYQDRKSSKLEIGKYNTGIPQHLYFLSDEEIKEGDWYLVKINYGSGGKYVNKSLARLNKGEEKEAIRLGAKKIIATTDRSLQDFNFDPEKQLGNYLPKPSQSFLEVFIKEYNKGNVIKEVMVEYEDKGWEDWMGDNENGEPIWIEDFKLKVNSKDNTITIKRVKDSWNREEVIGLIKDYRNVIILVDEVLIEKTNKWIEQNL